jgi:ABC-2 type transport system permease protein
MPPPTTSITCTYAALDQDHSAASRQLLAGLDGSGVFERVADLQREERHRNPISTPPRAAGRADRTGFRAALLSGASADVQVIADGRNSNTAGTAWVTSAASSSSSTPTGARPRLARCHSVHYRRRAWYNPNLETRWFMIPGMIGTLTLIQTMMLTAMSVAREREQGTFDQLLVTPFRPFEIMAGKALPAMVVGTFQATGVLLVAQLWFHIPSPVRT